MRRTIFLDAGHCIEDPGAVSSYGVERDCAMQIRDLLAQKLTAHFTVLKVPDNLTLTETIAYINSCCKNLNDGFALALHFNSNAGVPGAGAEGWYCGGWPEAHPVTQAHQIMKDVVDDYCRITGYANRGVFPDEKNPIHHRLGFVRDTKCFAGLIELCFINNKEEMDHFLRNPEQIAEGVYQGILKAFGISFLETNEEDMTVDSEEKLAQIYDEILFGKKLDDGAKGYLGKEESFVRQELMNSGERKELATAINAIRATHDRAGV